MGGQDRRLLLGVAAVLVLVFALVASNVAANHAPKPHKLPVGVVGGSRTVAAVAGSLARAAPDAYNVHPYSTISAARTAILDRSVYGAYSPGSPRLLLIASAASVPVAALLKQTFAPQGPAAAVRDVAPLPSSDPNGATAFSMLLSLIIAGQLGAVIIFTLGQHRSALERLAVITAMAIGAGLISALITNVLVGAFPGHFLGVWGVSSLFVLALAVPIAGFQALFGMGGTAIGAVLFLVIGNPASGGSSAPELLPTFWRQLSQLLPPGAAVTAMRDVVYFHGHGIGRAILVLSIWVIAGAATVVTLYLLRDRSRPAAAPAPSVAA
jgi:hypothetical protein